ncbi:hypothetical protein BGZ60DRAFT_447941 [Tricladium varicosporioides]|nr:hypothetical protein BGZ60DRAFT_447941 [Hymenoscyphus varicosporioides]
MLSNILPVIALATLTIAEVTPHAQGAEGTVMGPVAFLWPEDRPWSADADNTAPCGSSAGITNRTQFPLDNGAVSLSIAAEAYQVAFRIAYENNPTTQSTFSSQIVHNVTEVDPGHQCYRVPSTPRTIASGTNATIQLEYWSSYQGGAGESFYACADVTLVEASAFVGSIPCFNVTSSDFASPSTTVSGTKATITATPSASSSTGPYTSGPSSSGSGLSTAAKAGIAVGSVIGGLALIGAIAFALLRRRGMKKRDSEAESGFNPVMEKKRAASLASAETEVQK